MSARDISSVIELLQSNKVKTRNDALNLLSGYAIDNLRLSNKQFAALCKSLFKSLIEERDAKIVNSSTEQRLIFASTIIFEIVGDCLRSSTVLRQKLKFLSEFGLSLKSFYQSIYYKSADDGRPMFIEHCAPTKSSIAKCLALMMRSWGLFTHLSETLWTEYCDFCIWAIQTELQLTQLEADSNAYQFTNEGLLNQLYLLLSSLLGVELSFTISPSTLKKYRKIIFTILENTCLCFRKKESVLHTSILKIINKLIIILAGEDMWTSHCLIDLEIKMFLQFSTTPTEALMHQLQLAMNIESFHFLMSLDHLPPKTLLEVTGEDPDGQFSDTQMYNLERMIELQIELAQGPRFKVFPSDFDVVSFRNHQDWYNLRLIRLVSDNRLGWLVISGLAKLLITYFRIRAKSLHHSKKSLVRMRDCSDNIHQTKRRKTTEKRFNINLFQNLSNLLQYMLDSEDVKWRTCGLQLMIFICEHEPEISIESFELRPSALKSSHKDFDQHDSVTLLTEFSKHILTEPFWSLLACHELLARLEILPEACNDDPLKNCLQTVMKSTVSLMNSWSSYKSCSCIFISLAEDHCSLLPSEWISGVCKDIIDFPVMAGPPCLDFYSCRFWMTLATLHSGSSLSEQHLLHRAIVLWITNVCQTSHRLHDNVANPNSLSKYLPIFMSWLLGNNVSFPLFINSIFFQPDNLYREMKRHYSVTCFLSLADHNTTRSYDKSRFEFLGIAIAQDLHNVLLKQFSEFNYFDIEQACNANCLVTSAIMLSSISDLYLRFDPIQAALIEEHAMDLILSLAKLINLKTEALKVVESISDLEPRRETLEKLNFPFEIIDFRIQTDLLPNSLSSISTSVLLEDEFSQSHTRSNLGTPETINCPEKLCQSIYLYYLFSCVSLQAAFTYAAKLETAELLNCADLVLSFASKKFGQEGLFRLIRVMGEKVLSSLTYERDPTALILATKALRMVFDDSSLLDAAQSDCQDLAKYLLSLENDKLLIVEECHAYIFTLRATVSMTIPDEQLLPSMGRSFDNFTNVSLQFVCELIKEIDFLMPILDKRMELNLSIFPIESRDFNSVERYATICNILLSLSKADIYLPLRIVQTLTELSENNAIVPYLSRCILNMAFTDGFDESRLFLAQNCLPILKTWSDSKRSLEKFPYLIFGYHEWKDFAHENSSIITSIWLSAGIRPELLKSRPVATTLITPINVYEEPVIVSSLPKAIPLAFASNGIEKKIYQNFASFFKDKFDKTMSELLILIILETIQLTDFKTGVQSRMIVKGMSKSSLNSSNHDAGAVPSYQLLPSMSEEIISSLIQEFHPQNESFWSMQTIHFLLRRLSIAQSQPINDVRRLKFLIRICKFDFTGSAVTTQLMEMCLKYVCTEARDEVSDILSEIQIKDLLSVPQIQLNSVITSILSAYLSGSDHLLKSFMFLEKLKSYLENFRESFLDSKVLDFYVSVVHLIQNPAAEMRISSLEDFLDDEHIEVLAAKRFDAFASLILRVFPRIVDVQNARGSRCLISLFLNHHYNTEKNIDLRVKAAEYMAQHYLKGHFRQNLKTYAQVSEAGVLTDSMRNDMSFMVVYFENLMSTTDSNLVAYVESLIGVLLYFRDQEFNDAFKMFDINHLSETTQKICFPVNHKMFSLLYPDTFPPLTYEETLQALQTFKPLIDESQYCKWVQTLFSVIIGNLDRSLRFARVLSSFGQYAPTKLAPIIPQLVCHYIDAGGQNASKFVSDIIADFCVPESPNHCLDSVILIKDVVLAIRSRALDGQKIFLKFYGKIDLKGLSATLESKQISKTYILLLEDQITERAPDSLPNYSRSLCQMYKELDEDDFLADLSDQNDLKTSTELLKILGKTDETVKYENAYLDSSIILKGQSNSSSLSAALLKEGINGILMQLNNENHQGVSFEWAWKLNFWQMPAETKFDTKHGAIYSYFHSFQKSQSNPYDLVMSNFVPTNESWQKLSYHRRVETITTFFETLGTLSTINSILKSDCEDFEQEISRFNKETLWLKFSDLSSDLDILEARRTAFMLKDRLPEKTDTAEMRAIQAAASEILRYNNLSRQRNLEQKTLSSATLLDDLVSQSNIKEPTFHSSFKQLSTFQAAKALWAQGNCEISIAIIENLSKQGSVHLPFNSLSIDKLLLDAYKVTWMAEARFDYGSNLLTKYVEPLFTSTNSIEDSSQQEEACRLLAKFCDNEANSAELELKVKELERRIVARKSEIDEIKVHYGKTSVTSVEKKAVQKYYSRLKTQISSQTTELEELTETRRKFKAYSIQFFFRSILLETRDESVDKFFSLLLELASDSHLQDFIEQDLNRIPTHICVGWITQLLSRISLDSSKFQAAIQALIVRICREHPFHSLYFLISLEYHEEHSIESDNAVMASRVKAAKAIHKQLLSADVLFGATILIPTYEFCQESVTLAQYKASKSRRIQLDKLKVGDFWMHRLPKIPPPTILLPITSAGYENIPRMVLIDPKLSVAASGLSLPKIATFILSNGKSHRMLLKHSTDDIRQDAIMEQVFEKVNNLMSRDSHARRRNLRIRTYKAVPMGPKAGMIEFVPDTNALIEIVRPLHQKQDAMKIDVARDLMKKAQNEESASRVKVFRGICTQIQPVLRSYFVQNFRDPDIWFKNRLTYTRGIAASSIVGHILGLGDRHCNNILLDGVTGEPVHIDLGVAFDQGKRLPIPESVPFRLTRDIVDAFGVTGTRGLFSKACEHTLQVLRDNQQRIISILDVLRWDPLYSWSISPMRVKQIQETNEGEFNLHTTEDGSEAVTAILTVGEKLNAKGLSNSAVVRELIREATDEHNLAVIYCGWCPFY
ncbi:hypothetical protein PUMCH_003189 [Australozyma saopauloensis]|uniref:Serine/threonine-protein kinase Tel1 n=1 Tax=Australozyma saopauloensis TaxID=291208 RepID=A0AAX4HBI3_9ASCO|nr:hypothetical protein PUMCH_003189 [[Candida] saopauloensis]